MSEEMAVGTMLEQGGGRDVSEVDKTASIKMFTAALAVVESVSIPEGGEEELAPERATKLEDDI